MVNPDVDSYAKIPNHWKIIQKTQKNNNLLKTKWILKPKYHLKWRSGIHILIATEGEFAPLPPVTYVTGCDILFWHTVSCLYCNKIRAGGVAWFMGGSASCLINICFGWVNSWLVRRESFHNSGKSFFSISMTLALQCGLPTPLHHTSFADEPWCGDQCIVHSWV